MDSIEQIPVYLTEKGELMATGEGPYPALKDRKGRIIGYLIGFMDEGGRYYPPTKQFFNLPATYPGYLVMLVSDSPGHVQTFHGTKLVVPPSEFWPIHVESMWWERNGYNGHD